MWKKMKKAAKVIGGALAGAIGFVASGALVFGVPAYVGYSVGTALIAGGLAPFAAWCLAFVFGFFLMCFLGRMIINLLAVSTM